MSSKYKVSDQEMLYFLTFTVIDWVDLFTRPVLKHVIIDSLKFCQQSKGLTRKMHVISFVYMQGI